MPETSAVFLLYVGDHAQKNSERPLHDSVYVIMTLLFLLLGQLCCMTLPGPVVL